MVTFGAISAMPMTVSYAVPGTSKRCSGIRLMACVWLAAAGKFCWAVAGFVQAVAANAAQIANMTLSMVTSLTDDALCGCLRSCLGPGRSADRPWTNWRCARLAHAGMDSVSGCNTVMQPHALARGAITMVEQRDYASVH